MHVSPQNSNRNVSNHADVRCDCVSPQCVITQIKTVLETEQPPDAVLFLNERYLVHDVSADPWLARPSRPLEAAELASLATLRYRGIFADDWQQPAQSEESKQAHRDKLLDALLSMFHALVTDCQSLTPTLSSNKPCAYDEMAVRRFFVAISFGYRQGNPFHNFYHAFHVAQTYFALYCTFIHPVDQWEVCDRVAGFFAAFGHDYGHLGVTNSFLVAEEHPLALRYNGISVQEQHHAAMTLHLLSKYRVLEPLRILDLKEYRFVKDTIFQCILATDVAKHRNFLTELRNARTDETTHNLPNSETRRQLRIRLLVTCSDLSSEIRDEEFSKYWSACLREEFYQQGDLEMRKGGRPAPPFRRGETSLAQEQISFIDHLCLPIYTEAVGWFPSMSELVRRLEDKKRIWSQSV